MKWLILSCCFYFVSGFSAGSEDPSYFLDSCRAGQQAIQACQHSYSCLANNYVDLDPRRMERLRCRDDQDCQNSESGMICVPYEGKLSGFCECPPFSGFNFTSCGCQQAAECRDTPLEAEEAGGPVYEDLYVAGRDHGRCHNGMICADERCSCLDMTLSLYEPQTRLCLRPKTEEDELNMAEASRYARDAAEANKGWWTAFGIILVSFFVVAGGLVIYAFFDKITCNRGDYECDESQDVVDERRNHVGENGEGAKHVAAWELPSLDYLSEEQTMKYLKQQHGQNGQVLNEAAAVMNGGGQVNVSYIDDQDEDEEERSHSGGSGSLPEAERSAANLNNNNNVGHVEVHREPVSSRGSSEVRDV